MPSPDYVQSLARGLAVISCFDAGNPRRTLSDVARATDLTRATARRFLLTLVELGYVRTDGSVFWLTPRVLELGYSYLSSLSLPEIARPHLESAEPSKVRESTSVSILDGDDVVYVARVPGQPDHDGVHQHRHPLPRVRHLDGPGPARGTARRRTRRVPRASRRSTRLTGRTITPRDMPRSRTRPGARGRLSASSTRNSRQGLRSLAAPIRDALRARVVAAVNISTQAARYSLEDRALRSRSRAAVAAADADLGRSRPSPATH